MTDNIFKVWGQRYRILLNDLVEIDHLIITKDTACSIHKHNHKSNKFYVISGLLKIQTELGSTILGPNMHFTVDAPIEHQFITLEDSVVIECAYVKIDPSDIQRRCQGGQIINDKFISLDEK